MILNSKIQKLAYWTVPGGIYNSFINYIQKIREEKNNHLLEIIKSNNIFKGIHKGKRCFILCNGPSINTQNLRLLKGENVISVSNGYRHPDYAYFQPVYHCVPQLTYTEKFTENVVLSWFKEMDKSIGTAVIFLSTNEYDLVKKNNLFAHRPVHYTYFGLPWDNNRSLIYDISKQIPGVQSVPIMSLMIAMYMGFEKIYLLGTEHNSVITRKYNYFYDGSKTVLSNKIESVADDGNVLCSFSEELFAASELWQEYLLLNAIAIQNNIQIFNATAGGVLDVFPRIKFETLFS